jgi:hypothetical protein
LAQNDLLKSANILIRSTAPDAPARWSTSGPLAPAGPAWVANISPAAAATLLRARGAGPSAWPAGEVLFEGRVELRLRPVPGRE